jgi:hypothetical protein
VRFHTDTRPRDYPVASPVLTFSFSHRSVSLSSLLCLPAEIPNRIWTYTVSDKTFQSRHTDSFLQRFRPEPYERPHTFVLLRACRQIFVETALLSIATSVFKVIPFCVLTRITKRFPTYQLRQIQELKYDFDSNAFLYTNSPFPRDTLDTSKLKVFPGLRCVHIRVYSYDKYRNHCFFADKMRFHSRFEPALHVAGYDLLVKRRTSASMR